VVNASEFPSRDSGIELFEVARIKYLDSMHLLRQREPVNIRIALAVLAIQ